VKLRRRDVVATLVAVFALAAGPIQGLFDDHRAHLHKVDAPHSTVARLAAAEAPDGRLSDVPCVDGMADVFTCDGIDLLSFVPLAEMFGDNTDLLSGGGVSDIWGWTDSVTGDEYVLFGKTNGTAIYRITDPTDPVYVGELPNTGAQLIWHDIKIDDDYAFVVSESPGHGVKVFDLRKLRTLGEAPVTPFPLLYDSVYAIDGTAHNVVVNNDTDTLYVVGSGQVLGMGSVCTLDGEPTDNAGLHTIDIRNPLAPVYQGCYGEDGYIHDAQCAVYEGPDAEHRGRTICVNAHEDGVSVVDMTDPAAPVRLSATDAADYPDVAYAHQGWMSEDQAFYFHGDELDEQDLSLPTRTFVFDIRDLDDIRLHFVDERPSQNIDHNMYTRDGLLFQSNYTAGLEVFDVAPVAEEKRLPMVASFDTYPEDDGTVFAGTWSNYPYFESGTIAVSGIGEGLFLLRLQDHVQTGMSLSAPDDEDAAGPGKGNGRGRGGGRA
jgi:choice-of-anchor B domain-containing protein